LKPFCCLGFNKKFERIFSFLSDLIPTFLLFSKFCCCLTISARDRLTGGEGVVSGSVAGGVVVVVVVVVVEVVGVLVVVVVSVFFPFIFSFPFFLNIFLPLGDLLSLFLGKMFPILFLAVLFFAILFLSALLRADRLVLHEPELGSVICTVPRSCPTLSSASRSRFIFTVLGLKRSTSTGKCALSKSLVF